MNELQKRPSDEEVRHYPYYYKLSDYKTALFCGYELENNEYRDVKFFDNSVRNKILRNKRYKCWYSYHDAADPADRSVFYFIAYIEEVPRIYLLIEALYKEGFLKYINER